MNPASKYLRKTKEGMRETLDMALGHHLVISVKTEKWIANFVATNIDMGLPERGK